MYREIDYNQTFYVKRNNRVIACRIEKFQLTRLTASLNWQGDQPTAEYLARHRYGKYEHMIAEPVYESRVTFKARLADGTTMSLRNCSKYGDQKWKSVRKAKEILSTQFFLTAEDAQDDSCIHWSIFDHVIIPYSALDHRYRTGHFYNINQICWWDAKKLGTDKPTFCCWQFDYDCVTRHINVSDRPSLILYPSKIDCTEAHPLPVIDFPDFPDSRTITRTNDHFDSRSNDHFDL